MTDNVKLYLLYCTRAFICLTAIRILEFAFILRNSFASRATIGERAPECTTAEPKTGDSAK